MKKFTFLLHAHHKDRKSNAKNIDPFVQPTKCIGEYI